MMSEKPILFCGEMVRAILAGTKVQTRRIITPQPTGSRYWSPFDEGWMLAFYPDNKDAEPHILKPTYLPGCHRLWVREAWRFSDDPAHVASFHYRADGERAGRWHPSIFMPKSAARIWLEVTEVRAQRVAEISKEDAIAEGMPHEWVNGPGGSYLPDPRGEFGILWNKLNAKRGYDFDSNPWVWAYTFKRIDHD
jgi:hypothetical protein